MFSLLLSRSRFFFPSQARSQALPTIRFFSSGPSWTEERFHSVAEETIQNLLEVFEDVGDRVNLDGFDVQYSNGVLTLKLGEKGTYVINKQPPNKQIWLSSPQSGPKRYDYDLETQKWIYPRTQESLDSLLKTEISKLLNMDIEIKG